MTKTDALNQRTVCRIFRQLQNIDIGLTNKEDLYSFCKALNELQDKNKWLEFSLVNDHKILKDFIDICNRVQYEVLNNKDDDRELVKLAGIIHDMLQNMNVEVK